MRKIKFRAYFPNKAEMKIVATQNIYEGNNTYLYLSPMPGSNYESIKLMQYTGIKDKNGNEIYESDIVEFNNCDYQRTGGHLDDQIVRGKVTFACGGWMIETENGDYDLYTAIINDEELEVIGNIYEHPHLLEVQHD